MSFGREGLHVTQDGKEIAVVSCLDLALMKIGFGDDLDITPDGWYCSRRQRVMKWLETQSQKRAMIT